MTTSNHAPDRELRLPLPKLMLEQANAILSLAYALEDAISEYRTPLLGLDIARPRLQTVPPPDLDASHSDQAKTSRTE
jgi:hypothetical protein